MLILRGLIWSSVRGSGWLLPLHNDWSTLSKYKALKGIQKLLSSFHGAEKDRAVKYDFHTEKHYSYTENMILVLKIILEYLKYCLEVRLMC